MAHGEFPRLDLASFREDAGVSIEQIIETTKISRRFIKAIELGDYSELPGGVFTTSYIRQYASAIGVDPRMILDDYRDWKAAREQPPSKQMPASEPQGESVPRWARFFSTP